MTLYLFWFSAGETAVWCKPCLFCIYFDFQWVRLKSDVNHDLVFILIFSGRDWSLMWTMPGYLFWFLEGETEVWCEPCLGIYFDFWRERLKSDVNHAWVFILIFSGRHWSLMWTMTSYLFWFSAGETEVWCEPWLGIYFDFQYETFGFDISNDFFFFLHFNFQLERLKSDVSHVFFVFFFISAGESQAWLKPWHWFICLDFQLERLKSDLRDVLYSHKWTPDAYLLAKAYVAEEEKKEDSDSGSKSGLPKIPLKNQTRKL